MRKIISLFILLAATACSSTIESLQMANTQNLLIETPRVEGAECRVTDKGGRKWNLWETPGTVAIQEGHPPLRVICSKKGFKTSVLTINEHKEELLTIDGKRIDVSIYGDFPTKFPRLIPAAIKETAGFAQDPTGSLSTTYPNTITVWMEPKKWESEDQMREWAFDREVADRAEFINEEDAKSVDEQRKTKRRADSEVRDKKFQNFTKNLKKGINPAPLLEQGFKNTTKILNPTPSIERALEKGTGNPVPAVEKKLKALDPTNAKDFLNERNKAKERVRQQRALDDAAKSKDGKYPPLSEDIPDANAPQDIFSSGEKGSKYQKVYNADDNIKYDENGNRINR